MGSPGALGRGGISAAQEAVKTEVSTEPECLERPLEDQEMEFLDHELMGEWTRWKGPEDRVDVMVITSAQRASKVDVAEIFSIPRLGKLAEETGLKYGGSYDILTGWDFRCAKKKAELRERLEIMRPRLVLICPPCGAVSALQGFNKHHDMKAWLQRVKKSREFSRFGMQIADDQLRRGDLSLFEQPHGAKSWQDVSVEAISRRVGVRQIVIDQCMFGLRDVARGKLHRKRTRLMLNSEEIARRVERQCDQTHEHEHVGSVKTKDGWQLRSRLAQECPPRFCEAVLLGLRDDKARRQQSKAVHCVLTIESLDNPNEKKVIALLKRCHENLGPPSTPRFVAMLKAARANETCVKLAKGLSCPTCHAMQGEKSHNVSKAIKDMAFNDLLCVDTFEVELPNRKLKLLSIVDMATRYQVCIFVWKGIEIKHVRQDYRRFWKRWAGSPKALVSDGGPEFVAAWTDHLAGDGTEHCVTAAYAPWQNGVCERLGGAWKVAFAKAVLEIDPRTKEETKELCDQLNCAHNTLTRIDGYSPYQHVLGADVRVPVLGMIGEDNETVESALREKEDTHMKSQSIRLAARRAFLDADCEKRVRRAISHRNRPNRGPIEIGDQVTLWRKYPNEKKHHWHGPGRVIGVQSDKVWVMYGAKVYRCAPEQVKHVDTEAVELASWLPVVLQPC